ncbi:LOW QUALITY PROTEIN: mas-related G-protein coupled receptor member H-like [Dugong dugon]
MELLTMILNPLESTLYTRNESLDQATWSSEQATQSLLDSKTVAGHIYISLLICILGVSGNGLVISFLIFSIKRKPFTVYILHLAIADFMVLLCTSVLQLMNIISNHPKNDIRLNYIICLVILGYNTSLHLLTAISVERSLSVLYPVWYQCQRPRHQSAVACTLLWALSFLVSGLKNFCILQQPKFPECRYVYVFSCALTFLAFVPLMILSSLIPSIKVGCNRKPHQPARIYVIITATVGLFLVFAMPTKVLLILAYYGRDESVWHFFPHLNILSTIYCSVNPVAYFVVGSIRRKTSRESLKEALQRAFEEKPMPGLAGSQDPTDPSSCSSSDSYERTNSCHSWPTPTSPGHAHGRAHVPLNSPTPAGSTCGHANTRRPRPTLRPSPTPSGPAHVPLPHPPAGSTRGHGNSRRPRPTLRPRPRPLAPTSALRSCPRPDCRGGTTPGLQGFAPGLTCEVPRESSTNDSNSIQA